MYKIRFKTISSVKRYVNMTNSFPNLELTIKQGKYVVDGRSLMGIFSLNLLQDMMLEIICLHDDISIGVFLDNLVELDILVEELE